MTMRQGDDAVTHARVGIRPRHVPKGGGAHVHDRQRVPLAESARNHLPHHLTPSWCGHHFFRNTSRVTSFSRSASASNFLRRVFSISSSFKRFASDTLMPPNLLRHR